MLSGLSSWAAFGRHRFLDSLTQLYTNSQIYGPNKMDYNQRKAAKLTRTQSPLKQSLPLRFPRLAVFALMSNFLGRLVSIL